MKLGEAVVHNALVLQLHQVASKSDEKQKSFINSLFFCLEFQSVSRIVKIVHSVLGHHDTKVLTLLVNCPSLWPSFLNYLLMNVMHIT